MQKDLYNCIKGKTALLAAAGLGPVESSEIDTEGNFESLTFLIDAAAGTTGTFKIKTSDVQGGPYVDAPAADVIGTQGDSIVAGTVKKIAYIGGDRYAVIETDLSVDGVVSAVAVLGNARMTSNND